MSEEKESILDLRNFGEVEHSISLSAQMLRKQIVEKAATVTEVKDEASQKVAVQVLRALKGLAKEMEDSRQLVKKPVLDLGRNIDAMASEYIALPTKEATRINNAILAYQRVMREEAEAALAMAEKLEAKRQARIRKEAEAAATPEEAEKIIEKAEAAPSAKQVVVPATKPSAGMTVRDVWVFEVTDVRALYTGRPDLCHLEANTAAVNREMASGVREIPGLKIFKRLKSTVRS